MVDYSKQAIVMLALLVQQRLIMIAKKAYVSKFPDTYFIYRILIFQELVNVKTKNRNTVSFNMACE